MRRTQRTHPQKPEPGRIATMTLTNAAHETLVTLASSGGEGGGHGGAHESLNAYVIGGGALFALLLLLWITTRFNRDR
jgi:hypothetical protein